jgi:hypothetical protein
MVELRTCDVPIVPLVAIDAEFAVLGEIWPMIKCPECEIQIVITTDWNEQSSIEPFECPGCHLHISPVTMERIYE